MTTRCVILSGISGSGKSTLAKNMLEVHVMSGRDKHTCTICTADDFFVDAKGNYNWDGSKLGQAHAECFSKYLAALARGDELVICANTNLDVESISPYMLAAAAYGIEAEIITVDCDAELAARRNLHGLDERAIRRQVGKMSRRTLPGHWKHRVHKGDATP